MEPGYEYYGEGQPVIINPGRPAYRSRHTGEHARRPPLYPVTSAGYLAPAPAFGTGLRRSVSAAGPRVPPQVIINNTQWDDHAGRPRSVHDPDWDYDDDDWDERAHSPARREHSRSRSRARARTHGSRDPSPYYRDFEIEQRLKKLELLERKEEEEATRRRLEEQMIIKRAKEEAERVAKEKEEKELKKRAIEEDRIKQREKEEKAKRQKKEAEEEFREQVKKKFGAAGWSEETIEEVLDKGKHGENTKIVALGKNRPTFFKVHRNNMHPDVLDMYQLPWEWHDVSGCSVLMKELQTVINKDAIARF